MFFMSLLKRPRLRWCWIEFSKIWKTKHKQKAFKGVFVPWVWEMKLLTPVFRPWKKGTKTDWVLDCPTTLRSNYHKKMKQTPISAKQLDRDTSCKFNTYHILLLLSLAFPYIQNLPIFLLLTKSFLKKPSVH